jgi:hypothetical protein
MISTEVIKPITQPDTLSYPINFFIRAAYDIQTGKKTYIELANRVQDGDSQLNYVYTGLSTIYNNPRDINMSEETIRKTLKEFVNTIIGASPDLIKPKASGWEMINTLTIDEADKTESEYYHSISYWERQTLYENVILGMKVLWDDHGECIRTWYLTNTPVAERISILHTIFSRIGNAVRHKDKIVT